METDGTRSRALSRHSNHDGSTERCGEPREDRPQEAEAAASLEDTQELLGQNNAQMHGAGTWPAGAQVAGRRRR